MVSVLAGACCGGLNTRWRSRWETSGTDLGQGFRRAAGIQIGRGQAAEPGELGIELPKPGSLHVVAVAGRPRTEVVSWYGRIASMIPTSIAVAAMSNLALGGYKMLAALQAGC
jgi:hypothetical protein